MTSRFVIGSSPHIHGALTTQKIMALVLLALVPAGAAGIWFLGLSSLWVICVCVLSAVGAEFLWQKLMRQAVTVSDLSAAVTGLLLAYNLPPTIPLWMAACGSVFAIVLAKQFFGGLGRNIVNPALSGRAMMLISWPVAMTTWTVQGVSTATPLTLIKSGEAGLPSLWDVFVGNVGGCIGETSAFALLLGGGFLIYKDVISWRIPLVYMAVVAGGSLFFGRPAGAVYEVFSGGLMLGAFFMATDYTTTPISAKGQVLFAVGCGLLTSLIRIFGGYPEGVSYSILMMNLFVPLIDRLTIPKFFGEVRS
ncbi:MAG: Na+-transporting NADH:ubiquinone oxidoreductase subunit D [Dethiosulfovibrio peptidovorans]|nr:MAG: Na+-transporting NADH:ubiquinone oxidoreductase subunit D [Dethiosulfovibrio peptidovorans]